MYRIKAPSVRAVKYHVDKYSPQLKEIVDDFLNKGFTFSLEYGRSKKIKYTFGINPHSNTFTARFLRAFYKDQNVKVLLGGDLTQILNLVEQVGTDSDIHFEKGSKNKFKKHNPNDICEDFHTIMNYIFVERLYEESFDKGEFVDNRGLKVCPYCGSTSIAVYYKDDGTAIKPPIDHFLPKGKYPFLAMNFFNLIPVCTTCNNAPAKGTINPLADDGKTLYLQHPYIFDETKFTFDIEYNGEGEFNSESFNVAIDYKDNAHLSIGYNHILAVEDKYRKDKARVKELWHRVKSTNASRLKLLENTLGEEIEYESFLDPETILGYPINEESSREYEKYKFSKDLVEKMISLMNHEQIYP
ncbi:MAG: hypothetical protein NC453_12685 [Muribaculum sp.]|nr:hypothetical protein [Muribaculum sp.]